MLRGIVRDNILRVVAFSGLLFLFLAPFLSMFSMRQVQQLMVTLSLSWISLTLLLIALIIGTTGVWRDIERRWLAGLLGLPISRRSYLLARLCTVTLCIVFCGVFLGFAGFGLTAVVGSGYSTAENFSYLAFALAIGFSILKYLLVAVISTFFSTVATSLFLPLFSTIAILFAGTASQGVVDYLASADAQQVAPVTKIVAKALYTVLPNFSLFDFTTQAVYGLSVDSRQVFLGGIYFILYFSLVAILSVAALNRREL